MKKLNKFYCLIFVMFSLRTQLVFAQLDPSASMLTRSSQSNDEPQLDSGRYTVKTSSTPKSSRVEVTQQSSQAVQPIKTQELKEVTNQKSDSNQSVSTERSEAEKALSSRILDIILGGDDEQISQYKEKLHQEDPRQNLANITIAPTYFYMDSSSDYWFRDYNSSGPGLTVASDIWITPFMGVNLNYFTTLASELDVDPASSKTVHVDHRYGMGGFQFRKYSTLSRKSPSFTFGINYSEYFMIVPKEVENRNKLTSSGIAIAMSAKVPKTTQQAWTYGAVFYPNLSAKEGRTATNIKSGGDNTAYAMKVSMGHEYTLDRNSQFFWRLSHRADKMIYEGQANTNDPRSGTKPEGVTVTTGATFFEVGFTWGD